MAMENPYVPSKYGGIFNCHATMLRSVVSFKLKTNSSFYNPGVDQI